MMRKRYCREVWRLLTLLTVLVSAGVAQGQGPTVGDTYPHLAAGILESATLAKLDDGAVATAGDVRITAAEINDTISRAEKEVREQLEKNLFFVLEGVATEKLVVREAYKAGYGQTKREDRLVKAFLQHKVSGMTVSDDETRAFYEENKDTLGLPFEQANEVIKGYVAQKKQDEAILEYIQNLGRESHIQIDAEWVQKQYALAKENPVDRARSSGVPTMIEFGATGCKPCDMMQPVLNNLRGKYQDKLNVVFVHVREDQILSARYGITSIPVQVFFDKSGKEFFRHVGFYPQSEVEKRLSEMGVGR